ncbi:MAG: type I-D CRISPR-associated protein Cas10d/Csc3 [Chloroflexota bacterium]|nr:type I-D CRISPR-associated protein Cas10d/Csc3 [Chloroflexota bacterium]
MFYLDFLKQALDPHDQVTRDFVEHMLPGMMEHYAEKSAKGGEHSANTRLEEETKRKFEAKDDQSMVSHLLNGIFPTMRLLNLLEAEQLGPAPFSEVERRVYILAYLMHDVDKIRAMHGVDTESREAIERAKDVVAEELRRCNVEGFFPDFATYLEDITFLVVNTQQKYGTHLHTYLWRLQLRERRVLLLRRLCTYSDHIAYLVTSPSTILLENETLTTILAELSDDELVFTYHQLREVRGLLTNVINNGVVDLFTRGQEGHIWPYLFFSDGVVYIRRKALQFTLTTAQIVEAVQDKLRALCAQTIKKEAPGFKFSIQGIAKHPGYYFEFLSLEDYATLLADFTIKRTTNDVTSIPFAKLRQMQASGEIASDLLLDFPAGEKRIGMIGRFLSVVFATVLGLLDKKQELLRQRVEQAVVEHLGLAPYWEQARTIPNKGGVEYRWFWLGGCYLRDHPGITEYEGRGNLSEVFTSTLRLVLDLAGDELRKQLPQLYLNHLTSYLENVIELPLSLRSGSTLPDFRAELERYAGAKGKKHTLICTLCNSAYPTEEQADNAVLFQPWVYKNKLSLYAGKNAGGVCAICALELMLRQILQKGQLRLTGSKFEALKTKYLAVYPNFFFTAETGAMVQGIIDQLHDINFFTVRRTLDRKDITVGDLLHLDAFAAPAHSEKKPSVYIYNEEADETAEDTENADSTQEDAEEQAQERAAERGYIKFEQGSYPGMCFFGMKAGKESDDTSTWAMPAFLALALPLVTNTKVVISDMVLPLFSSGHDFRETVIFDAPHTYLAHLLHGERIRVNQLLQKVRVLASIYTVNLDTYAKQGKPEWKHLSAIARDLETDPLFLFRYLRKQERSGPFKADEVEQYLHIYQDILEEDLGKIERCVDRYTVFYRGGYQAHSILKPVDIMAKAIINSPLNIEEDDLLWQIQGELRNWLDRVRSRQAIGWAVFWGKDIDAKQAPAIEAFVKGFYAEVFRDYCQGERGLLRNRINRFKDGCEAYYVHKRNIQSFQEESEEVVAAQ